MLLVDPDGRSPELDLFLDRHPNAIVGISPRVTWDSEVRRLAASLPLKRIVLVSCAPEIMPYNVQLVSVKIKVCHVARVSKFLARLLYLIYLGLGTFNFPNG